jgi:hypothetical protein
MSDEECIHGMTRAWCGSCQGVDGGSRNRSGEYGFHGGEQKQDLLDDLCDIVGLRREPVGRGSSLPSHVFEAAARAAGVRSGSMPEIGESIASKAGLVWGPECDSRGSLSGGGSTVTKEGLAVMVKGLRLLD